MLFKICVALAFLAVSQAGCPLCDTYMNIGKKKDPKVLLTVFTLERADLVLYLLQADDLILLSTRNLVGHVPNFTTTSSCMGQYQSVCCDAEDPPAFDLDPTNSPTMEKGDEPECKLCGDDTFPSQPNNWVNARYVGSYSCSQLYHRGKAGKIPGFMCGPLQLKADELCGCGDSAPVDEEEDPVVTTNRPVPPVTQAPTLAPIMPTCDEEMLSELSTACDCKWKKENKEWKDEDQYIGCVEDAVADANSPCTVKGVLDFAKCLPFSEATEAPTEEDEDDPSASCDDYTVVALSSICDCTWKKRKKEWKNEKEYIGCVEDVVSETSCDLQAVLDASQCLPFSIETEDEEDENDGGQQNGNTSESCSQYTNKNDCKESDLKCKWKNNVCKDKNRRRLNDPQKVVVS